MIWRIFQGFYREKLQFFCMKNPPTKYKGFPPTAKTLTHVFIHNFWTERFQIKYEYILKTRKTTLHHITKAKENRKIGLDPPSGLMSYFVFLSAWIQKLRNGPCLLLLAYLFRYKLFERLKLDIMHTKKSYMASLCLYFEKSTLNLTSSNITHF